MVVLFQFAMHSIRIESDRRKK